MGADAAGSGASASPSGRLAPVLVATMAVATGLSVANNYYAQPLLPVIGRSLHLSATVAGLIVTFSQIGYVGGLVLLLPLGDLLERRRLVVVLSLLAAGALLVMGGAPSGSVLLAGAAMVGMLSVLAQALVPFAASLASDAQRGRVVGQVMSGLLLGILLARTVAGLLAETGSWRTVYLVSALVMVVQAVVLWRVLPVYREDTGLTYPALLRSVGTILREEPVLQLRALYGAFSFGAFGVLWTSIAFLLSRHYHEPPAVIGLFGLAGAAGAMTASLAGRRADRGRARSSTAATAVLVLVAWPALWLGRTSVVWLVIGIVVLDVGAQGIHITNQSEIFRLRSDARSRVNAGYLMAYFIGGGAGSAASAAVYGSAGWGAVCGVGAGFGLAGVVLWLVTELARRRGSGRPRLLTGRGTSAGSRPRSGPPAGRCSTAQRSD